MRLIPAIFCVLILGISAIGDLEAKRRFGPSPLDTLGEDPDQEIGRAVLNDYRQMGIGKDYQFRFQLKIMPRREKTVTLTGMMIGTAGVYGPVSRIDLYETEESDGDPLRILLKNGPQPQAWWLKDSFGGITSAVSSDQYFDPIAGSDVSIFDLFTPFQYWSEFYYEGRTEFRGRPTHLFWMYPPVGDINLGEKVSGVRVYVDDQFHAMVQAELFDVEKVHVKTLSIIDIKKVDGTWIPGAVDSRNEISRNKTRFKVVSASVDVELSPHYFEPEALSETILGKAFNR